MRRKLLPLTIFVLILCGWEIAIVVFNLPPIVLPHLLAIFAAALNEPRFLFHSVTTVGEALGGFIIGNCFAAFIAILILRWRAFEASLMPYAIALKTTPVVAVAPILIVWFDGGWWAKAIAAATVCFFPTLIGLVRGLRLVESRDYQDFSDLFKSWNSTWLDTLLHLRIPFSLPFFFSALKVSSSLAVVGAIVAEFIAADSGLGFLIVIHSRHLESARMFSAVFACTAIGVVWFYAISIIERLFSKRYGTLASKEELL